MILPINCNCLYTKQTRNTRTTHELTKTFKMSITRSQSHTQLKKENEQLQADNKDLQEEIEELKEKNKSLNNDILEIGAELNKRCEGEILFHQNSEGDNFLVEIHRKAEEKEELKKEMAREIRELFCEVRELKKQNKGLQTKIDDMESEVLDAQDSYALQKQTEQVYYHGEPLMCIEDGTPITISDVFPNKFIKENKELKTVSDAKSDTILNMFSFIIDDPEEVQEGFTIKRDWGSKYNDDWNKIVTDELKDMVKEINGDLDDEMEWKTDGYEFSLHIKDEEEEVEDKRVCLVGVCKGMKWNDAKSFIIEKHSEEYWVDWIHRVKWGTEEEVKEEYVPQESSVDMDAFKKLKEGGMMPWAK